MPFTLDHGYTMADLSGDTDDDGNFEVWPLIWEKAYREFVGWEELDNGGWATNVWQEILATPSTPHDVADLTAAQLQTLIRDSLSNDCLVAVGTVDAKADWTLSNGVRMIGGHAYVVTGEDADGFTVYNPYGSVFTIPFADLKDFLKRVYVN